MLRPESPAESGFRAEVRGWLAASIPDDLRFLTFRPPPDRAMAWYRELSRRGWVAPHWPREHGGMGASAVEQVILAEELARAGAPDLPTQGLNHIGPILIHHGTEEQRRRHLPPILEGQAIWCQGYSEPNAGSDLASLRTRARVEGEHLVIDGQKIWSGWAHHAGWMFALVRTGEGRGREGITFVLIDLASPGITRRPILTLAEDDEFAEVFFDSVRVPVANVVGEIGQGWAVATALLAQERLQIGHPGLALRALERLRRLVALGPVRLDARRADLVARAEIEVEALVASFLAVAEASHGPASDSSYLKILSSETTQLVLEVLQDCAGELAAVAGALERDGERVDVSEMYLQSRRLSIYGGTNEIQRNLIARQLGLGRART